ncbi:superoxide dismutase family protein [Nocardiopsis sp. NRRL B-16309]|uniref:superoxide dismutase family protein n=1 Tax=Nocardiopsis sp. NRRL B-16309 TaxID=1519494 RepID=UPI0006AF6416|nr:superoxide dismutase family protein [Nocardiopsis sp. NRRL B-16309]KOX11208.1 superoxide dismutase [Nocardiopsis sp. NRRL B-16309]
MRTTTLTVGLALTAILATGCAQAETPEEETAAPTEQSVQPTTSPEVTASIFMEWSEGAGAVTYDETAVPVGATADVQVREGDGRTSVQFTGTGLEGDREFGAHVHTRPCGEEPSDAGPHYQNEADPAATEDEPSSDPAYANPENELWLDFTTDADGNAVSTATVDWTFREGEARSLVLHEQHTSTEHGEAGTAGDRVACVTVEF